MGEEGEVAPLGFLLDTRVSSLRKDAVQRPPRWKDDADACCSAAEAPDAVTPDRDKLERSLDERSLDRSLERWSVDSYSSLEKPESEEKARVLVGPWPWPWSCGAEAAEAEQDEAMDWSVVAPARQRHASGQRSSPAEAKKRRAVSFQFALAGAG